MRVRDLDGIVHDWKAHGQRVTADDTRARSKLHLAARQLIYGLFPTNPIIEEVLVHPRHGVNQFFDFYVPKLRLVIEVHGQQHYKFNSLFHSSATDFVQQKKRDQEKKDWCDINNITYIELPYNEGVAEWQNRIMDR